MGVLAHWGGLLLDQAARLSCEGEVDDAFGGTHTPRGDAYIVAVEERPR